MGSAGRVAAKCPARCAGTHVALWGQGPSVACCVFLRRPGSGFKRMGGRQSHKHTAGACSQFGSARATEQVPWWPASLLDMWTEYVCVFNYCMYVYHVCTGAFEARRENQIPKAAVTDGREPLDTGAGT